MTELEYIPFWKKRKTRARKMYIHMSEINEAVIKLPWWRLDSVLVYCPKCGSFTIRTIKQKDFSLLPYRICMSDNCDFRIYNE